MNLVHKCCLHRSLLVQTHCQYRQWTTSSFDYLNKQLASISQFNTFSNKPTGHFFESLCQWSLQSVLNIWNHTCNRKEEYLKENLTRCGLLFLKAWFFSELYPIWFSFCEPVGCCVTRWYFSRYLEPASWSPWDVIAGLFRRSAKTTAHNSSVPQKLKLVNRTMQNIL